MLLVKISSFNRFTSERCYSKHTYITDTVNALLKIMLYYKYHKSESSTIQDNICVLLSTQLL